MLYFVEFNINYAGLELEKFLKIWLEDTEILMGQLEKGAVRQLWKVVGERKSILVLEIGESDLDKLLMELPLMKKLGNQVDVKVTALLPYETFATNLNEICKKDVKVDVLDVVTNEGLFFLLEFNVEYHGLELDELLRIWLEEAGVAIGAKKTGLVVDIWKCVGMRRVYVIICVDKPDMVDLLSFSLPVMKQMGNNVDLKVKSLRGYEGFQKDLKTLCGE